jgi:6-phosphogluconate dehydrogenase (decarboxylating)
MDDEENDSREPMVKKQRNRIKSTQVSTSVIKEVTSDQLIRVLIPQRQITCYSVVKSTQVWTSVIKEVTSYQLIWVLIPQRQITDYSVVK